MQMRRPGLSGGLNRGPHHAFGHLLGFQVGEDQVAVDLVVGSLSLQAHCISVYLMNAIRIFSSNPSINNRKGRARDSRGGPLDGSGHLKAGPIGGNLAQ